MAADKSVPEMKVSAKQSVRFYIRSAQSFLKGTKGREADAENEKEAIAPKPPVEELSISGLGNAINTAIACASNLERLELGTVEDVQTNYIPVEAGNIKKSAPHIVIKIKRNPNAPTVDTETAAVEEAEA